MPPIDQQAVNLAKAIKRQETGNAPDSYTKRGQSGEFGAYQFMPDTYKTYAKKYLNDENAEANVENQNKIAYSFVKEKKDAGFTPAQIASMWNAGEDDPDAYKGTFSNGKSSVGTNDHGAQYDVPGYTAKVSAYYKELSGGQTGIAQPHNAGDSIQPTVYPQVPLPGEKAYAAEGGPEAPKKDFLQQAGDIVNTIFPGKQIGESIGTLAGYIASPYKEDYDTSAPTPLQVVGDTASAALSVGAPGVGRTAGLLAPKVLGKTIPAIAPAKTALGTFGRTAGAGAGLGVTSGIAEGETDAGALAQRGLVGGAVGTALGVPAAGLKAVANLKDPTHIISNRVKVLQKLQDNNGPIRRVIESANRKGVDTKKLLSESDLLVGAVDENGTVRSADAIAKLDEHLDPVEGIVTDLLKKEGLTIPLANVEKHLKKVVQDSGLEGGALVRALKNVEDDIGGYALKADEAGNIPLSLVQLAKISKSKTVNYLNPESKIADKAIARGLKELVEDNAKIADMGAINKELQQYYAMRELLEILEGRKVQGGRFGKYFSQTIGSIVGSHFGPLGAIAGAEAGGRIMGKQMKGTFGGKIGSELEHSGVLKSAQEKLNDPFRKLPVQAQPSSFTDELPVIDAGPTPKSKSNLPVIDFDGYTSNKSGSRNTSQSATKQKVTGSKSKALKNKKD